MPRIEKLSISAPAGVTVALNNGVATVKSLKGEPSQRVDFSVKAVIEEGQITFEIDENSPINYKQKRALHGPYRSFVNSTVVGINEGYKKILELAGVGYHVSNQDSLVKFSLDCTHPTFIQLPSEVEVETKSGRNQDPIITLESADKQLLGLIRIKIRSFRKPEPYKGKGVLFQGEAIHRESGKTAATK